MDVTPSPPRNPRPGDPFARPGQAPVADAPKKPKRKKGRTFFLGLLFISGFMVAVFFIIAVSGKDIIVDFYRDVVVPRGIPEALAPEVSDARARELVQTLHAYFDALEGDQATDELTLEMMSRIESAMGDEVVTLEETEMLLESARTLRPGNGG